MFCCSGEPECSNEIPLQNLSDGRALLEPDVARNRISQVIGEYEKEYKTISLFNASIENGIYYKIRELLLLGVNINIEDLFNNDTKAFKMVLAAFFGQRYALEKEDNEEEYKKIDLLPEVIHPLHTVILMCYAADSMQKELSKHREQHELRKDKFKKLKWNLQDIACNMINNLYNQEERGPKKAMVALQEDCKLSNTTVQRRSKYRDYLNEKYSKEKEIMAIAYQAEAMKFLSQKPCQILMDERFRSRKTTESGFLASSGKAVANHFSFCLNMREKLRIHGLFRGLYILLFAYMLCCYPIYADKGKYLANSSIISLVPFAIVLFVLMSQVLMTAIKAIDYLVFEGSRYECGRSIWQERENQPVAQLLLNRFEQTRGETKRKKFIKLLFKYFSSKKLAMWRLVLVWPLLLLEAQRFLFNTSWFASQPPHENKEQSKKNGGWVLLPIFLELLYCMLFAIATLSSIRYLYTFQSIGFFSKMIRKMRKTVFMFTLIFSIFWFVLAVIHVSISRSLLSSEDTVIYKVFSVGKFEIFGEVQDEDRVGNLTDCAHFKRNFWYFFDMDYTEASCLFRTSIIPFLVFAYIFITGVLLVNLLTAQLTKEYEEESENSKYYYGYLRYEQLAKIESKLAFPPPFSFVYCLFRILFALGTFVSDVLSCVYTVCTFLLCVLCMNRRGVEADRNSLVRQRIKKCMFCIYTYSWDFIWKCTIKLEGRTWGAVVKVPIGEMTNPSEDLRTYLANPTTDLWEKLKAVIEKYENKEINSKKLIKAQTAMFSLFENEKREEYTREMMKSRVGVRRDDQAARTTDTPLPLGDIGHYVHQNSEQSFSSTDRRVHVQGRSNTD